MTASGRNMLRTLAAQGEVHGLHQKAKYTGANNDKAQPTTVA
jgi:hypothetical protein